MVVAGVVSQAASPLPLDALLDLRVAVERVAAAAPEVVAAGAAVSEAEAFAQKAALLPNPELEGGLASIALDPALMPFVTPTGGVPNTSVMLGTLIELGKREHRQAAASGAASAAGLERRAALQGAVLDLYEAAAEVAALQIQRTVLDALVEDAEAAVTLQARRAAAGDAADLDVARASLEAQRLRGQREESAARLAAALVQCGQRIAASCTPFSSVDVARALLQQPPRAGRIEERPDLQALEARAAAAAAEVRLAEARAIPDPTVKVGYLFDPSLLSEAMVHNGLVAVSVPLPVFDRGQEDARAARARQSLFERSQALLRADAVQRLAGLDEEERALRARLSRLDGETLPLARDVVSRLEAVVERGGGGVVELLLARRALADVIIERGDLDLALYRLATRRLRATGLDRAAVTGDR
jgi:cobalt-zinc-cadmium efflux system outer membrane protein